MQYDPAFNKNYDAIIIGARCAGAATAMLLARRGARVLLVDRASPGTDTISTHALMRGAVMQLDRWGVLPRVRASGTPAIRQTTFHYGRDKVCLPIKPTHGVDALYGPRRSSLDSALVAAAWNAGATIRFGTSFRDVILDEKGRVTGAILAGHDKQPFEVHADIVVGADGRRSTVARRVHSQIEKLAQNTSACIFGYVRGLPDTGTHWHYAPGIGTGIIPTNSGLHCAFVAVSPARFMNGMRRARGVSDLGGHIAEANPECGAQIAQASLQGQLTGFVGQRGFMRRSWGRGWALVGDAGYFKDPLTAHGITDALRDAECLADAISGDSPDALARYQHERDTLSADLFAITDQIAGLSWSLPQLKDLHQQLNAAMKKQQDWMINRFDDVRSAA